MHELAIAQALVDQASTAAARAKLSRISRLNCRVGILRMIDASLLNEAFEAVRDGTACSVASLGVETVRITARCPNCGTLFEVHSDDWRCGDCGVDGTLQSGDDEFMLLSVEGTVNDDTR